jgi:hypothetical protein
MNTFVKVFANLPSPIRVLSVSVIAALRGRGVRLAPEALNLVETP